MIYIIELENFVKIGFTEDPVRRLNTLQTTLPMDLNVLLVIMGGRKLEKALHYKFRDLRVRGEWFIFNDEILDYIDSKSEEDLRYKYGFTDPETNILMPIRQHRLNCGLTLENLGAILGITRQGAQKLEQSANRGGITLNSMHKIAEVTGYKFEFRFKKK